MAKKQVDCSVCDGSRSCQKCGGSGKYSRDVMDSILGRVFNVRPDCPRCKGTGDCTRCHGKGYIYVNK